MSIVPTPRYRSLDSLRGLAALAVVLDHCVLSLGDRTPKLLHGLELTPLSVMTAGRLAVILFFVISGFVLSLPYIAGAGQRYVPYLARRICRLYIPCAFALLVALGLYLLLARPLPPDVPSIVRDSWGKPVPPAIVADHFLMTGYPMASRALDYPLWSLIIEMRASIVFPLLVLLVFRLQWIAVGLGIAVALASAKLALWLGDSAPYVAETLPGSLLLTTTYLTYFVFGIMIAVRLETLQQRLKRLPPIVHWLALPAIACVWCAMQDLHIEHHNYANLICGVFAVYLVAASVTVARAERFLAHPVCAWLGRISFSLYLLHYPILLAAYALLYPALPSGAIIALALPVMAGAATLMQMYVEGPSVGLSRRVGKYAERLAGQGLEIHQHIRGNAGGRDRD